MRPDLVTEFLVSTRGLVTVVFTCLCVSSSFNHDSPSYSPSPVVAHVPWISKGYEEHNNQS